MTIKKKQSGRPRKYFPEKPKDLPKPATADMAEYMREYRKKNKKRVMLQHRDYRLRKKQHDNLIAKKKVRS